MIEIVELEHLGGAGVTRASVVPAWGANLVRFGYRQSEWASEISALETVDADALAASPTSFGMPLLAPTPGRVGRNQSGRFRYRGLEYAIAPSRHGMVRQAPWRVVEQGESELRLETEIEGPAPFHFRATHQVSLGERLLRSRVGLENIGQRMQPLNVGWHPYLRRPPGPCEVSIPAAGRWVLDDELEPTPTGEIESVGADRVFFAPPRFLESGDHWDDVFTGLEATDGLAVCWIESEESVALDSGAERRVTVRRVVEVPTGPADRSLAPVPHVQLYTPPGREAISIEPLSSVPDAINLAGRGVEETGLCEVPPGGRIAFEIALRLEIV